MNGWNTLHNLLFQVDLATRTYMAYVLTPSPWAYLLTQPMSTPIYCRCLGLIFFHHRWMQSHISFLSCMTETIHFGFITVPTVADTPKNLHPNTLGNHFEIHFQWHINSSLVNNPWSKIFTKETFYLDYTYSTNNYFGSILRVSWVQCWLPNWHVYNWSDCSIIYTVMDKIVIQEANQYRICITPHTPKNKIIIYNQTCLLPEIAWSLPSGHLLGKQILCYCKTFMISIVHGRKQYRLCMFTLCIARVSCPK